MSDSGVKCWTKVAVSVACLPACQDTLRSLLLIHWSKARAPECSRVLYSLRISSNALGLFNFSVWVPFNSYLHKVVLI